MKNYIFSSLAIFSFCFMSGQQLVTTEETYNGTPLTITMDSRTAAALHTMENNCNRTSGVGKNNDKTTAFSSTDSDNVRNTRTVPTRKLTTAEICSRNPKISGYKIQIAVVKSNEEANAIKTNFRRMFPRLKVETDASLRPNYKILAGSYFSRESASGDLKQIKSTFKEAVAVQRTIYCVEGK